MAVRILKIAENQPEMVEIRCHGVSEQVQEIAAFVKSRQGHLTGVFENRQYEIPVTDIYYIESVDNRVFLYSGRRVYETRQRLYELEAMLRENKIFLERLIPYTESGILARIRTAGELVTEDYRADGIFVQAYVPRALYPLAAFGEEK